MPVWPSAAATLYRHPADARREDGPLFFDEGDVESVGARLGALVTAFARARLRPLSEVGA